MRHAIGLMCLWSLAAAQRHPGDLFSDIDPDGAPLPMNFTRQSELLCAAYPTACCEPHFHVDVFAYDINGVPFNGGKPILDVTHLRLAISFKVIVLQETPKLLKRTDKVLVWAPNIYADHGVSNLIIIYNTCFSIEVFSRAGSVYVC